MLVVWCAGGACWQRVVCCSRGLVEMKSVNKASCQHGRRLGYLSAFVWSRLEVLVPKTASLHEQGAPTAPRRSPNPALQKTRRAQSIHGTPGVLVWSLTTMPEAGPSHLRDPVETQTRPRPATTWQGRRGPSGERDVAGLTDNSTGASHGGHLHAGAAHATRFDWAVRPSCGVWPSWQSGDATRGSQDKQQQPTVCLWAGAAVNAEPRMTRKLTAHWAQSGSKFGLPPVGLGSSGLPQWLTAFRGSSCKSRCVGLQ